MIDTNVLIAALINPTSPVWSILEVKGVDFYVPEFALSELGEYKGLIKEKLDRKGKREEFDFLISELFRNVTIIPEDVYSENLSRATDIMRDIDEKDSPYIALAMSLECPIWSNDRHFGQQKEVLTHSTEELMKKI